MTTTLVPVWFAVARGGLGEEDLQLLRFDDKTMIFLNDSEAIRLAEHVRDEMGEEMRVVKITEHAYVKKLRVIDYEDRT